MSDTIILGAGITGLSAGIASGFPIFEATSVPGGICSSYYMNKNSIRREYSHLLNPDEISSCYRFELGGGHWIFGNEPYIQNFIRKYANTQTYSRNSAVYLPNEKLFIPYPLQNHLRYLSHPVVVKALQEMVSRQLQPKSVQTMAEWLEQSFGPTLGELFFYPFHNLYTAGLWKMIAPQDSYKSPTDLNLAIYGAFLPSQTVGYNSTFIYPQNGLDTLANNMAKCCNIHYNKQVIAIDTENKCVCFADGTNEKYITILATLPLHHLVELAKIPLDIPSDPSPSVLVVNIGAKRTQQTPEQHWLYIPYSKAGFHRVGFYSNVDSHFLPNKHRISKDVTSLYVEKAYPQNTSLSQEESHRISKEIIQELQDWGWIAEVEVYDPTWICSAYTWSWPNNGWKEKAQKLLRQHQIYPVGRYACWTFQGIEKSIQDGLVAGNSFKNVSTFLEKNSL